MSSSSFLAQAVILIGGIFSVNLGAYLGFSFDDVSTNKIGISTIVNPFSVFSEGINDDYFMSLSAWIYLLGLFSAMILWGFKNFKEDPTRVVPLLPSLSRTFLGVLAGALMFVLTRP